MTYPTYTLPNWIADEQLLRDEAVLFGLSEARPDDKIAVIRLAFATLTAPLEKQIEQHHEAIGTLNGLLESTRNELILSVQTGSETELATAPFTLFLAGTTLSLGLGMGLYAGILALLATPVLALLMAGFLAGSGCILTVLGSYRIFCKYLIVSQLSQENTQKQRKQLTTTILDLERQKQAQLDQLYRAEATLNQQQAHRDELTRVFASDFDLARSIRHQLHDRFADV